MNENGCQEPLITLFKNKRLTCFVFRNPPRYSTYYKRQFMTTNTNSFAAPKAHMTHNPGIVSEITKRKNNAQAQ